MSVRSTRSPSATATWEFSLNAEVGKDVSLRVHNFNSERLKVNDLGGNPIEIGTFVVWRVSNTAQTAFDVEDCESDVEVQTEAAVSMVQMALDHLKASVDLELDDQQKAAMTCNLMVVLCSESETNPVINTGVN